MDNHHKTYSKRQRDLEDKRKADRTSAPRTTSEQQKLEASRKLRKPPMILNSAHLRVLALFRKYLMTPQKMLCLGSLDLESFRVQLRELTDEGLLVSERFEAGYSLTTTGFDAMNQAESPS